MKKNEASKNKIGTEEQRLREINISLRSGDQKLIAEILECTSDYVGMVLRGERKSERVLSLTEKLIENRDEFIQTHKKN